MRVKAAVARAPGARLRVEGLTLREPRADEILVRLVAAGVTDADLSAVAGHLPLPFPFVPGREGAGIVERVGAQVSTLVPGDAVLIGPDACGICSACTSGHPFACVDFATLNLAAGRSDDEPTFADAGQTVHGRFFGQSAFATHLVCRARQAIRLPNDAPLEIVAPLAGELLLAAGTLLKDFRIEPGDTVMIHGAGVLGCVAILLARAREAGFVIVADAHERRRAIASDLGADIVVHSSDALPDVVRSVATEGVRYALVTLDRPEARAACLASLAPDGICAIVPDLLHRVTELDDQVPTGHALIRSADLHASPAELVRLLLGLRAEGMLPLEALIEFFAFENVNDALDALAGGKVIKAVLRFPLGGFADLDRAEVEGAAADVPEFAPDDDMNASTGSAALIRSN